MRHLSAGVFIGLAVFMGCDADAGGDDAASGCQGGKCDDADDALASSCLDDHALLIEAARDALLSEQLVDPDFEWSTPHVEEFTDLDYDGRPEKLVFPGLVAAGGNQDMVLFLSQDADTPFGDFPCATAGWFNGVDIQSTGRATGVEGVDDVLVTSKSGACHVVCGHYAFDGNFYQEMGIVQENLCDDEGGDE